MSEKCALILEEKANCNIAFMCALLGVARSSYYEMTTRVQSRQSIRHDALTVALSVNFV
jgi:hypothetical protein